MNPTASSAQNLEPASTWLRDRLSPYFLLIRPWQVLIVAVGTMIGALVAGGQHPIDVAIMVASTTSLFAASVTFNDLCNVREDQINSPQRPLAVGSARTDLAVIQSTLLFFLGSLFAAMVSLPCGLAAIAVTMLSIAYSLRLKGVPLLGNLVVACVSAYAIGCWLFAAPLSEQLVWGVVLLGTIRLGGEIIKTAEDESGDSIAGLQTIATRIGAQRAHGLGLLLLTTAVLASVLALQSPWRLGVYLAAGLVNATLLAYGVTALHHIVGEKELGTRLVTVERGITGVFMTGLLLDALLVHA